MEFENDLKIGTLGEQTFSTWCSAAQLTCNRSLEEDRTGWDHQVEFPYIKTHLPRDKQLSPIQCRVQVKSTQRRDRKWTIKVSVLKRLIDYSYPSFLLFIEFTNDPEPVAESAFLVHIDEKIIEKTLKAIRKNDTQKSPKELYDVKISISYSKKHKLPITSGESFRDSVVNYVPDADIVKYQKAKTQKVETVGYGNRSYQMQFQASAEELDKHITAQSIGSKEFPVNVKNSVIFDNRFNLKNGSIEIKRFNKAKLVFEPKILDTCQLRFKDSKYSPSIDFEGEFVSSININSIGKNKLFFRTTFFCIELGDMYDDGIEESKIHLTLEKQAPLDTVLNIFRLFHKDNIGKQLICEIELFKEQRTLNLQVGIDFDLEDASAVIDALGILKGSFNIDGRTLTTPNEMFSQQDRFTIMVGIIQNKIDGFKISLDEGIQTPPQEIKTPYTIVAEIGKTAIGVIALFYGDKIDANDYQVTRFEILQPLVFNDGKPSIEELEQLEKQAIDKAESLQATT